jgi:hypothetical protein
MLSTTTLHMVTFSRVFKNLFETTIRHVRAFPINSRNSREWRRSRGSRRSRSRGSRGSRSRRSRRTVTPAFLNANKHDCLVETCFDTCEGATSAKAFTSATTVFFIASLSVRWRSSFCYFTSSFERRKSDEFLYSTCIKKKCLTRFIVAARLPEF